MMVDTSGRGFVNVTSQVSARVEESALCTGSCHLFLRHTSASLCLTENADPRVRVDLERVAQRVAPDGDPAYLHDDEGPDDMPAHIRTLIAGHELTIPIGERRLLLGTWQGIFVWEHRYAAHRREIVITLNGER